MQGDITIIKTDVSNLQSEMVTVQNRLTKIELIQENEISKKLQLIYEGYSVLISNTERIEMLEKRSENTEADVFALKLAFMKDRKGA